MASGNVLRNRKRFVSEKLDLKGGEQILFGSVDGEAMVVDDWWELNERARRDRLSSRMNRTPMTLIPTNKRVVFYQARDWLSRDRMAEIPLGELVDVTFDVYTEADKHGKRVIRALATFVAEERSGYPSIMFRTEITDLYTFNAERRVILTGICQEVGIHLSDMTDYQAIAASGIPEALADASQEMYEDMMENGEPPQPLEDEVPEGESEPQPQAPTHGFGRKPSPQGQPQMTGPILADYGQGSRDQGYDPMAEEAQDRDSQPLGQQEDAEPPAQGDYRARDGHKPDATGRQRRQGAPHETGGDYRRPDSTGDYRRPDSARDDRKPGSTGDYRRPDSTGNYRRPDSTGKSSPRDSGRQPKPSGGDYRH